MARLPIDMSRVLSTEAMQPTAMAALALELMRGVTSMAGVFSLLVLIMAF